MGSQSALESLEVHISSDMKIYLALWPIVWGLICTVTKAQSAYQEGNYRIYFLVKKSSYFQWNFQENTTSTQCIAAGQ